jgi:hypothetical protein
LGAINSAVGQIKSIPETLAGPLVDVFNDLANSTEQVVNSVQNTANTANGSIALPNNFISYITSPSSEDANNLLLYYEQIYPNTNVVISQYSVEAFNVANSSSP